jgi:DNA modification methylase
MLELDTVHCMDNCDGLMLLPRESIDLVVTSPPYDELRTYGGHSWDFYGVAWNLARVLKPGGALVWVVGDQSKNGSETGTSMEQALHFLRLGLNLHDTMIYAKDAPPYNDRRYQQEWEYMFVFSKGVPKTTNLLRTPKLYEEKRYEKNWHRTREGTLYHSVARKESPEDKLRGNVWFYLTGGSKTTRDDTGGHPAVFPEKLALDHIASWSNRGDVVLDPFMGSGTVAKAAKALGRHYIGFEINPEYVETCKRRTAQGSLEI